MAAKRLAPTPGIYPIDTGTAELIADPNQPDSWLINVNGVPSSHLNLADPLSLDFPYLRWSAMAIEAVVAEQCDAARLRVTHLGGAGGALAVYLAHRYPTSRNTVVEIDGELARLVRQWFELPRSPRVKFRVGEAFAVTQGFRRASRDVIIRDVFAGDCTPLPLTSGEFFAAAHNSLAPGGLYVANCASDPGLAGARTELAGMAEVFAYLAVLADARTLKGKSRGNLILLGSDLPLPDLNSRLLADALPARYRCGPAGTRLLG